MSAATPSRAVRAFLDPLQLVVSCVTQTPLVATEYRPSPLPAVILFANRGDPVRLHARFGLSLVVRHEYRIVESGDVAGRWEVHTVGYSYQLLGEDGGEVLTFHWHPGGASPVTFPHLHIGRQVAARFSKLHVPTGFVPLQAVVWFAISELGVEPLRDDWGDILDVDGAFR